jgi:crotonobetainyl-CoA:carnitine CoA-transferase CaiB-like acyl-CoA transferase
MPLSYLQVPLLTLREVPGGTSNDSAVEVGGGPLAGVRVLDLSSVIMGPLATRILADFGASVIKVEPPQGDVMRLALPARNHGMGALFMHLNRGKRSVVLDLKTEAGRDALLRLCLRSDVFIHNTRLAALARLGLGYADVARANPAIVYVSLVGYGQGGPGAALQAYDDLIQGASGLASLFALDGGEPRYVPSTIVDRIGGLSAVNVVLAALLHRTRTGKGQAIEVPMFETLADIVLGDHLGGESFVPAEGPMGYARLLTAMRRPYRTLDGYLCVLVYNEGHWTRFFEVSGNGERYRSDARLNQPERRRRDYHYAYGVVAEVLATRTSAEWLPLLRSADVPAAPFQELEEVLHDPQLVATGFLREREHPTEGRIRTIGVPSTWSTTQPSSEGDAPTLGQHTDEVLRELDSAPASTRAPR